MSLLYIKSIHIIFVVSWFAGLFYIVRLFIYHTEAEEKPKIERDILQKQFILMEKKLWYIITTPAMVLTTITGFLMIYVIPNFMYQPWMWAKLGFIVGLLIYHFYCQKLMKELENKKFRFNSTHLRLWNEGATVFLVAIVFIIELKSAVDWIWGFLGLSFFVIVLMIAVKIYKYYRLKKESKQ